MHEKHEVHHHPKNAPPRIPLALQNVFLNGNRGIEVNTPPPDKSAMTTFRRSWMWWGRSKSSETSAVKGAKARKISPKVVDTQLEDAQVITSPRRKKKKVRTSVVYVYHFTGVVLARSNHSIHCVS
jgi:hypothetical protein